MAATWEGMAEAARRSFEAWRGASRLDRRRLMEAWLGQVGLVREELARLITEETGKPITLALGEVGRAEATLRATADAVAAFGEEAVPYDLMAGAEGCRAVLRRFPVGPILAITPFNFPVNLAVHKLGPALAAGCSAIWKPCPRPRGPRICFGRASKRPVSRWRRPCACSSWPRRILSLPRPWPRTPASPP
jgi:acyl-CoA reductase-like NAD-dependent aldehyde dehydrogenase